MRKLLSIKDLQERYGVHENTAKKYMHQMEHMENPLRTWEDAVEEWERSKTVYPKQKTPRPRHSTKTEWKIPTWEEVHRIA